MEDKVGSGRKKGLWSLPMSPSGAALSTARGQQGLTQRREGMAGPGFQRTSS